ncbi:hypothetical protein KUCAC02_027827 [Chaenocephalus aceratus]|nr:hypothetical protein KUCAC02_027827 [Chaenocephalus aceratus]
MVGIETMQTEENEEGKLRDANRKQEMEVNEEGNEKKVAKMGENGERVEMNANMTVLDGKGFDGKGSMEETELEGRAHPPPATLAAGFSKMGKGRNAGGGGSAFVMKGHCESTTEEGREGDEQSAGEGPFGKGQNKENHEKGSGDGKDDGLKDGKAGKREGKGKEGIGEGNGNVGEDVFV